jgi:hypothetical protein
VPSDALTQRAVAELAVEARRTTDRLLVVGPRLAARGTSEAQATLDVVRRTLQDLADLVADAEGRPRRTVPQLGPQPSPTRSRCSLATSSGRETPPQPAPQRRR